jgi:hypothetical protein
VSPTFLKHVYVTITEFLDFFQRLCSEKKKQYFENWVCFRPPERKMGGVTTLLELTSITDYWSTGKDPVFETLCSSKRWISPEI